MVSFLSGTQQDSSTREEVNRAGLRFLVKLAAVDAGVEEEQAWILEETRQILDAKSISLYLCDESNAHSLNKKTLSEGGQLNTQLVHLEENHRVVEIMQSGRHLIRPGISENRVAYLPLMAKEEALGVIELESEQEILDVDLMTAIGASIAHSLAKSRGARQAQETIQTMQTFQDQLLNSRNTLRALFDSSPTSIYIIDPGYNLIAINMSRADLTGKSPQELVGKQCFSILHQRESPCPGCQVEKTFQTGDITRRIEQHGMGRANAVELEISTYPIWDSDRQVVQAFLFEEDVTERQRLQASLAQSEKLASVGQLAAGVAHEINNPLTTILANAQLLQRSLPAGDKDLLEMVALIIQASDRASRAVGDLLNFARRERYELAPTDLNETIHRALALIGHELGSRTISLEFEPAINLPTVNASQDHLQGVWLNLLINAIDAIDQGPGKISIKTLNVGKNAWVLVTDNGVGIPPDEISRIFEPFYTTKEPGRGTGLGLSVCHQILTRHGGQILVSSQLDQGTTFTVVLPLS
jgi:two-component system NtrC family sensor kinase